MYLYCFVNKLINWLLKVIKIVKLLMMYFSILDKKKIIKLFVIFFNLNVRNGLC